MLARAILLVAFVASHATADPVAAPACGPPRAATTLRSVRDVDWCNFDVGFWKGRLREGHVEVHLYQKLDEPHDTVSASLRGVVYGDFDGDKRPEAAVVIESATWSGKSGRVSGGTSVKIYSLVKGTPTSMGAIPAGTPVDAIVIAKGIVSVTSGPATAKTTLRYRRVKGDFVEAPAIK